MIKSYQCDSHLANITRFYIEQEKGGEFFTLFERKFKRGEEIDIK